MFDQNKQMLLSILPRTVFITEVCSYFSFSSSIVIPLVSADTISRPAHDVVGGPKAMPDNCG